MSKSNNNNVNTNKVSNNYGSTMIIGKESHGGEVIIENNSSLKKIILKDDVEVDCMRIEECENLTSFEFGKNARINYLELESNDKNQVRKLLDNVKGAESVVLNKEAASSVADFFIAGLLNKSPKNFSSILDEDASLEAKESEQLELQKTNEFYGELRDAILKNYEERDHVLANLSKEQRSLLLGLETILQEYITNCNKQDHDKKGVDTKSNLNTGYDLINQVLQAVEDLKELVLRRRVDALNLSASHQDMENHPTFVWMLEFEGVKEDNFTLNFQDYARSFQQDLPKCAPLEGAGKYCKLRDAMLENYRNNKDIETGLTEYQKQLLAVQVHHLQKYIDDHARGWEWKGTRYTQGPYRYEYEEVSSKEPALPEFYDFMKSVMEVSKNLAENLVKNLAKDGLLTKILCSEGSELNSMRNFLKEYFELRDAILKNYKKGNHVLANLSKEQRDLLPRFVPELKEAVKNYRETIKNYRKKQKDEKQVVDNNNNQDHDKENADTSSKLYKDYKLILGVYRAARTLQFMLLRKEIGAPANYDRKALQDKKSLGFEDGNACRSLKKFLDSDKMGARALRDAYVLKNLSAYAEYSRKSIAQAKWRPSPLIEDYRRKNEISPLDPLRPQEISLLIRENEKAQVLEVMGKKRDLFIDLLRCDKLNEDCIEVFGAWSTKRLAPTMQGIKKYFKLRDAILKSREYYGDIEVDLTEDQKQLLAKQLPALINYVDTHVSGWACEDRSKQPELPEDYALISDVYEAAMKVRDKNAKNENARPPSEEITDSKPEAVNNPNDKKK